MNEKSIDSTPQVSRNESLRFTQIINDVVPVMAAKGYHGTSMTDLEQATGLTRSHLYYYIQSKQYLLYRICKGSTREQIASAKKIIESSSAALHKLSHLILALVSELYLYQDHAKVRLIEFPYLDKDYREDILRDRRAYTVYWTQILDEAVQKAEIVSYDPVFIPSILGMINYSVIWYNAEKHGSIENVAQSFSATAISTLTSMNYSPEATGIGSNEISSILES